MINILKRIFVMVILIILFVILNGCEETTTTTEIFPDGSCKRTVIVKSNSDEIFKYGFPLPADPSWTISEKWEKEEGNKVLGSSKQFIYTAEKFFPEVSDLNAEYKQAFSDPLKINVEMKLEKRFAWFFSYITYSETYRKFFPFEPVPLEDYFSSGELEVLKLYLTDDEKSKEIYPQETLDKIEKKFEAWYNRSIFEEFHRVVLEGAKHLKDSQLKPGTIESRKEELYNAVFVDYKLRDDLPICSQMLTKYEEVLKSPDVHKIREQDEEVFSRLEDKFHALDNVLFDEFTNVVTVPGLITDTNAGAVTGNRVTWEFGAGDLLIGDYKMWVTSRTVNWWMVGIAGTVVVLAAILLTVGAIARGRRK